MEKTSDEIRDELRQKKYEKFLKDHPNIPISNERISLETSLVLLNSMFHRTRRQLDNASDERKKELNEEIDIYQNEKEMLYNNIDTEEIKNKICDVYSPILKADFAESVKKTTSEDFLKMDLEMQSGSIWTDEKKGTKYIDNTMPASILTDLAFYNGKEVTHEIPVIINNKLEEER